MTSSDPLVAIADELYAAPAATFTRARDDAAKAAASDGEGGKELARRVKALRKPSTAAWAVNLLVRRESDQIDQVLTIGASLRDAAAAMDGDELRALTRQRRQLTSALASTARSLAREHDVRLSGAVVDQVEGVLNAAMLDPVAADAVRTGLLIAAFTSTGVSDLDVAAVVAVPEAMGVRATPRDAATPARPDLRVVPEGDAVRRARAQDALEAAAAELAGAEEEAAEADRAFEQLSARRLQVQDELDGLRRRIAQLEEQAEDVEADIEEAQEQRDDAREAVAEAGAAHEAATRALAAFDR